MKLRSILSGFLVTAVITVLTLILLSVLMFFTNIGDSAGNICMYVGTAAAVAAGAFSAAKTCGGKMLFNSLSVSVLFILSLVVLSLILNRKVTFNTHFFAIAAGSIFSGFMGAVAANR